MKKSQLSLNMNEYDTKKIEFIRNYYINKEVFMNDSMILRRALDLLINDIKDSND